MDAKDTELRHCTQAIGKQFHEDVGIGRKKRADSWKLLLR